MSEHDRHTAGVGGQRKIWQPIRDRHSNLRARRMQVLLRLTHIRTLLHQLRRAFESTEGISAQRGGVRITERERRVLSFVFEGLANKQIADRLQISESAVKASLQQLFTKTGVRTRSQLVRIALEKYRDL
jgi:DNA-binding NarL/FixJ family response regulator